jgi:UDP-2,3-diacylglucosamine pyrophosphatase LpxH
MPTPIASNPPRFDLAYVISDLHIGGGSGGQMFSSATQFKTFIDHVLKALSQLRAKRKDARMLLVINGDFVDFLAEPDASVFNLNRSAALLRNMFERPEFSPVLDALRKFVAANGTHLVITLGNHDVELALPDTSRALLELLTKKDPDLEGNIELCFDGWGYRFQVGGKRALCLHGNESDGYNFTRYDELDRIIHDLQLFDRSEFGENWRPNAGSWFVINAINPIKHQFAFIDLLKPEFPLAATVLGVLDPTKAAYAFTAGEAMAKAVKNELARPVSQRRMLAAGAMAGVEPIAHDPGLSQSDIEDRVEHALAEGTIDELIHEPVDAKLLALRDWLTPLQKAVSWIKENSVDLTKQVASALTGAARFARFELLRTTVRPLVTDEPHDVTALNSADKGINQSVRAGYDIVFAGHTHIRRIAPSPDGHGLYVNTGTWAGLMSLTRSLVDSPVFEQVYDALRTGDREALKQLTVDGARLLRQECTIARMSMSDSSQVTVALGGVDMPADGKPVVQFPETMTRVLP